MFHTTQLMAVGVIGTLPTSRVFGGGAELWVQSISVGNQMDCPATSSATATTESGGDSFCHAGVGAHGSSIYIGSTGAATYSTHTH